MSDFDDFQKQVSADRANARGLSTDRRYKGVRGWLLLFCVGLTILAPLLTVFSLISGLSESAEVFEQFPGLRIVYFVDAVLSAGLMAFSMYAGISLWTIRPGAVKIAKTYLLCLLGYQVIAAVLPFTAGLPSAANQYLIASAAQDTFKTIIYFGVWYSYLCQSERVRATYAQSEAEA